MLNDNSGQATLYLTVWPAAQRSRRVIDLLIRCCTGRNPPLHVRWLIYMDDYTVVKTSVQINDSPVLPRCERAQSR
jgi:hypothetical protein